MAALPKVMLSSLTMPPSLRRHRLRHGLPQFALALMALSNPLHAAVSIPSVPEPPTPAPTPDGWFAFQDDLFGDAILDTDDFRTGGVHAGVRLGRFLVAVDASELTNRGNHQSDLPPDRSDELSYSLGYIITQRESRDRLINWMVVAGAGGRSWGDFHGDRVQNAIHGFAGFQQLHMPYDREHGTAGLGYVYGRSLWLPLRDLPAPLPESIGLQAEAAGVGTTEGEEEGVGTIEVVALGSQGVAWFGWQYQRDSGTYPTRTADIVARHEAGGWWVAGIGRQPGIYVSADADPRTGAVDGNLGFTIAESAPVQHHRDIDETLDAYANGGSIGLQVRARVGGPKRETLGLQHQVLFDYHFGTVEGYDAFRGDRVEADQVALGYEPVLAGPIPGLPALISEEFVYGAGGVRVERVEQLDPGARFSGGTATAPVAQGGAGVRFGLNIGHDPERFINQIRLGVGYDGWIPLRRQVISNGADHAYYLKPGSALVGTLGFAVYW